MAVCVQATGTGMPPKLDKDAPSGRINVVASAALLDRLDEWRAHQRPIPNKSEAARMIMEIGLDAVEGRLPISRREDATAKG